MTPQTMTPLLNVEDAARSIRFYTEALSFRVVEEFERDGKPIWALLQNGEAKLMINQPDRVDSADGSYRRARPSYGETVLYFHVASAHDTRAELSAAGYAVGAVTTETYGVNEFLLRDPDGYEIAIGSKLTKVA